MDNQKYEKSYPKIGDIWKKPIYCPMRIRDTEYIWHLCIEDGSPEKDAVWQIFKDPLDPEISTVEWIKVNEDKTNLPRDGEVFLVVFRGRVALCQYDLHQLNFSAVCYPAELTGSDKVEVGGEEGFYYWMPLPLKPSETDAVLIKKYEMKKKYDRGINR